MRCPGPRRFRPISMFFGYYTASAHWSLAELARGRSGLDQDVLIAVLVVDGYLDVDPPVIETESDLVGHNGLVGAKKDRAVDVAEAAETSCDRLPLLEKLASGGTGGAE